MSYIIKQSSLKFKQYLFASITLPILYLLIINYIINKFKKIALLDSLADIIVIIPLFMILFYSLNIKSDNIKELLFFGSLLYIFNVFIELALQELIIKGIFGFEIFWILSIILQSTGFILLFFGFVKLFEVT